MKFFLAFSVLFFTAFSFSQEDTISIRPLNDSLFKGARIISIEELNLNYMDGCAHGHICCYAGCHCCPELNRAQIYDTIVTKITNGVKRIVIAERYAVAREHDVQPTHIRFKKNGKWSEKYYPVDDQSQIHFTEYPREHLGQKVRQPSYEKDVVLVRNTDVEFMMLDPEGNEIPMTFNVITVLTPELSVGSKVIDNRVVCALLKPDGMAISRTKYTEIAPFDTDGLAVVQSTYGTGLIDKTGKEVIPTKFYSVNRIGENRYSVAGPNGPTHIYDGQGNKLTRKEYNHIGNYSDGLAFARMQNNSLCYLDMDGKEVIRVKEEWAYDFSDGMAAVNQGGKWGFIDKMGKSVIPCQYYNVRGFQNGIAAVAIGVMNDEKWILIDKTGKQVNKKMYSEIMAFKSGIAQVRINGFGYGFIDIKGNEVMECKYTDFGYGTPDHWDVDGMFVRSTIQDRKVLENSLEIVDVNGKQLASLESYIAYRVLPRNGNPDFGSYPFILVYKKDNKCNIVDFKGNTLFKSDYDNIMVYTDKLAVGVKGDQYFILNPSTGEVISNFGTKPINNIQYGIVSVVTDINSYVYDFYDLKGRKLN